MTLLAPRDVARRLRLSTSRVVQLDREGILRPFAIVRAAAFTMPRPSSGLRASASSAERLRTSRSRPSHESRVM
jgi:hypothetical protein